MTNTEELMPLTEEFMTFSSQGQGTHHATGEAPDMVRRQQESGEARAKPQQCFSWGRMGKAE